MLRALVLRTLMKEGREATADERDVLVAIVDGEGYELRQSPITDMMRRSSNGRWGRRQKMTSCGYYESRPRGKRGVLSISRAALTSYYTPTAVAKP